MNDLSNASFADQLKSRTSLPAAPEFDAAMEMACSVFELVESHQTPPIPKAYEVWYSYASKSDEMIKQRIDVIVENGGVLSAYDIEQIHQEYHSAANDRTETSLQLESEMDAILKLVESYITSSESFSGSLS